MGEHNEVNPSDDEDELGRDYIEILEVFTKEGLHSDVIVNYMGGWIRIDDRFWKENHLEFRHRKAKIATVKIINLYSVYFQQQIYY